MPITQSHPEETEVGHKKFRFTSSVLHSEIYEERTQILLSYERETVKNSPREESFNFNSLKVLEIRLHL